MTEIAPFTGCVYPNETLIPWGVLIVITPYLTGLVAGAFTVFSFYHVFGICNVRLFRRFLHVAADSGVLVRVPVFPLPACGKPISKINGFSPSDDDFPVSLLHFWPAGTLSRLGPDQSKNLTQPSRELRPNLAVIVRALYRWTRFPDPECTDRPAFAVAWRGQRPASRAGSACSVWCVACSPRFF